MTYEYPRSGVLRDESLAVGGDLRSAGVRGRETRAQHSQPAHSVRNPRSDFFSR